MCSRVPANSSGLRTSTSWPFAFAWISTCGRNARIGPSLRSFALYFVGVMAGTSRVIGRPSFDHFRRPPSMIFAFVWPKSWNTQKA